MSLLKPRSHLALATPPPGADPSALLNAVAAALPLQQADDVERTPGRVTFRVPWLGVGWKSPLWAVSRGVVWAEPRGERLEVGYELDFRQMWIEAGVAAAVVVCIQFLLGSGDWLILVPAAIAPLVAGLNQVNATGRFERWLEGVVARHAAASKP